MDILLIFLKQSKKRTLFHFYPIKHLILPCQAHLSKGGNVTLLRRFDEPFRISVPRYRFKP